MSEWKGVTNAGCENLITCISKCCNMRTLYIDTLFDVTKFISLIHILNCLNISSVPVFALKFPNTVEYSCGKC